MRWKAPAHPSPDGRPSARHKHPTMTKPQPPATAFAAAAAAANAIHIRPLVAADAVARPGEDSRAAAMAALTVVGMQDLAARPASSLPYGAQRRLEIARALALRPSFLLLDEPAAGMNPAETDALIAVLRQIRADHEIGLLVVEHDLKLIMRLCDHIVVLNKGQMIAEGTPEAIRANPAVIEAYIGKRRAAA